MLDATPYAKLNQWEPDDKPKRVQFNQDNANIDSALSKFNTQLADIANTNLKGQITGKFTETKLSQIKLAAGYDYNTLADIGIYTVSNGANAPTAGYCTVLVTRADNNPSYIQQEVTTAAGSKYIRAKEGAATPWAAWNKIWDSGNISFFNQTNGYHKFPNGLTIQWGTITNPVIAGETTVTFSLAFTSAHNAQITQRYGNAGALLVNDLTNTNLKFHVEYPSWIYWVAIGYIA